MTAFKSDVEAMEALQGAYKNLTAEIGKAIVGQETVVKNVLISISAMDTAYWLGFLD